MLVFRHSPEVTSFGALWQHCTRSLHPPNPASSAASFALLRAFARLECALADRACADFDEALPHLFPFREASRLAAHAWLQPERPGWRQQLLACLPRLHTLLPPPGQPATLSTWEGFRFYALFPDRYLAAADGWRREHPQRPAWVIGLRSMGSALAPVVAAYLEQTGGAVRFTTLRPRGDPQQRCCRVGPRLQQQLRAWPGDFLLVDEGPGLSGSSLGGAALLLESLGIPSARIALMPSWEAPPDAFHHRPSAAVWQRLQRYPAAPLAPPADAVADLSAGRWRTVFPGRSRSATWPQQERVKYLSSAGDLIKFAGLGPAADAAVERARMLAAAGFAPAVTAAGDGWIRYRITPACPLSRRASRSSGWRETAGSYLAFLASHFRLGDRQPPHAQLLEMAAVNLQELLGPVSLPPPPEGIPVAVDARLQPQEWGWADHRWIKFDGVDHCDDPFFPGPCDIAWDLAAVEIEYGPATGQAVTEVYRRRSGDRQILQRLPWHRLAYCAFRTAYSRLVASQTQDPDAARWRSLAAHYQQSLHTLAAPHRHRPAPTADRTR